MLEDGWIKGKPKIPVTRSSAQVLIGGASEILILSDQRRRTNRAPIISRWRDNFDGSRASALAPRIVFQNDSYSVKVERKRLDTGTLRSFLEREEILVAALLLQTGSAWERSIGVPCHFLLILANYSTLDPLVVPIHPAWFFRNFGGGSLLDSKNLRRGGCNSVGEVKKFRSKKKNLGVRRGSCFFQLFRIKAKTSRIRPGATRTYLIRFCRKDFHLCLKVCGNQFMNVLMGTMLDDHSYSMRTCSRHLALGSLNQFSLAQKAFSHHKKKVYEDRQPASHASRLARALPSASMSFNLRPSLTLLVVVLRSLA
ncbi:hypothetical protein VNO77_03044 [Canavalia gladiata]|uniref:Uncharacterized protein n=1 Tax=Canavalia gladiata TaxID=3824 RepID=A0AAN9MU26_CANGL